MEDKTNTDDSQPQPDEKAAVPAEKARLTLFKAGAPPLETDDDVFARSITEADKEAVDKGAIAMMLAIPLIMLVMVGGVLLLAALKH